MIILDTNVLSEMITNRPHAGFMTWTAKNEAISPFTTSICTAELFYGVYKLPDGKRKTILYRNITDLIAIEFADRILSFNAPTSKLFGQLYAGAVNSGWNGKAPDAMIAAVTLYYDATLVTRNVKDFKIFDIKIINPFES